MVLVQSPVTGTLFEISVESTYEEFLAWLMSQDKQPPVALLSAIAAEASMAPAGGAAAEGMRRCTCVSAPPINVH